MNQLINRFYWFYTFWKSKHFNYYRKIELIFFHTDIAAQTWDNGWFFKIIKINQCKIYTKQCINFNIIFLFWKKNYRYTDI